jgi:hypothetical protein
MQSQLKILEKRLARRGRGKKKGVLEHQPMTHQGPQEMAEDKGTMGKEWTHGIPYEKKMCGIYYDMRRRRKRKKMSAKYN